MTTPIPGTVAAWAGLIGLGLMAAGCNSTTQQASAPSGQAVRPAVETAPADLQLLCAAEAANVYAAPADKVLPTASARSGSATYTVELNVNGRPARCTIDESGTAITIVDV
ncbi:hypothetical protein [Microbaculum marinum]|uniref:DUF4333 domain-containing protein n=1 Tax=Microbaculum marinum TaxID=1764581 RepID=A0AAW9RRW7_9HYPH